MEEQQTVGWLWLAPGTGHDRVRCRRHLLAFLSTYSLRRASIGALRAALAAGTVPNITPTSNDIPLAKTTTCQLISGVRSVNILITISITKATIMPITPPAKLS